MPDALRDLAAEHGIVPEFYDIMGARHETSDETRHLLLSAMGIDASTDRAIGEALAQVQERRRNLPRAVVVEAGTRSLRLAEPSAPPLFSPRCELVLEDGERVTARLAASGGAPVVELDTPLSAGYHALHVDGLERPISVIASPGRCYLPPELREGRRLWGVSGQLYSFRSDRNWGIGDLTDVRDALAAIKGQDADALGLNPLHALSPRLSENVSPYSPSTRVATNVLYVDIEQIPELLECPEARDMLGKSDFHRELLKLRVSDQVDYVAVAAEKRRLFEVLYRTFRETHLERKSARAESFRAFQHERSETLRPYAVYEAVREELERRRGEPSDWQAWPAEYRDPASPAVADLARERADVVELHEYCQFVAEEQLAAVAQAARDEGLRIGLYLDVALGSYPGGAETWAGQSLYSFGASMGAPPDDLGPGGQDWGLPPLIPWRLADDRFETFRNVLRHTMRHAGAIRLDHVMSLLRLYWVPAGRKPHEGAYVRYPFDELLGIVALESVRNRCVVIGEDLGTVPDEVRAGMKRANILAYKVLFFMRDRERFFDRREYPELALVVTGTHDLPTLRGFWEGRDIELRRSLNLWSDESVIARAAAERHEDKQHLCELVTGGDSSAALEGAPLTPKLLVDIHEHLAASPCHLQIVQLEDVAMQAEQVNVPGTMNEHPNWRCKMSRSTHDILTDPLFVELAAAVRRGRAS